MTRGGLAVGGGGVDPAAGIVWHEPVSGTPTEKDTPIIKETLLPVLEAIKLDSTLDINEIVGLSQQLDMLYFYRQEHGDVLAVPVEEGAVKVDNRRVICDSPDCRAAAVQILGVEKLAWVHPDLTDVV